MERKHSDSLHCHTAMGTRQSKIHYLVQIQEIVGLLGDSITSTMVALISVQQKAQQAITELGEELAADVVLAIECGAR